jgi:hypothetical protein
MSDRPHNVLVPHVRLLDTHGMIGTRPGCQACMEYHGPDYGWTPDDPDMTHPTAALRAAVDTAIDADLAERSSAEQNGLLAMTPGCVARWRRPNATTKRRSVYGACGRRHADDAGVLVMHIRGRQDLRYGCHRWTHTSGLRDDLGSYAGKGRSRGEGAGSSWRGCARCLGEPVHADAHRAGRARRFLRAAGAVAGHRGAARYERVAVGGHRPGEEDDHELEVRDNPHNMRRPSRDSCWPARTRGAFGNHPDRRAGFCVPG